MLQYYSHWVFILWLLWSIGYICKINILTTHIHPYYATILASVGFTLLMIYHICIKHQPFDISLLIVVAFIHYIPLYISYKYSKKIYSLENLIISLVAYGIYMVHQDKDVIQVYLREFMTSWDTLCKKQSMKSML